MDISWGYVYLTNYGKPNPNTNEQIITFKFSVDPIDDYVYSKHPVSFYDLFIVSLRRDLEKKFTKITSSRYRGDVNHMIHVFNLAVQKHNSNRHVQVKAYKFITNYYEQSACLFCFYYQYIDCVTKNDADEYLIFSMFEHIIYDLRLNHIAKPARINHICGSDIDTWLVTFTPEGHRYDSFYETYTEFCDIHNINKMDIESFNKLIESKHYVLKWAIWAYI